MIAAGGTAGHVLPALAVAQELRERGVLVTFAGSPDRAEARLVPEAGFELDTFRIEGLPRRPSLRLVRALARAGAAPFACRAILERRQADVVLGGGGFVAGPMVLAAWTKRIPAALTEADRIFLAYPIEGLGGDKYPVVGRPLPQGAAPVPQAEARFLFGLPAEGPVLGVFGALAGAKALNELAVATWGERGPAVLHQTGRRDYDLVVSQIRRADYRVIAETDRFGAALAACDLVVARAGSSVWEIAAAGRPAILVPYPYATGDHQRLNAEHFERAGGALCVPETELAGVPTLVVSLLADRERLAAMGTAMRAAARPDAGREIAEGLVELAARRG